MFPIITNVADGAKPKHINFCLKAIFLGSSEEDGVVNDLYACPFVWNALKRQFLVKSNKQCPKLKKCKKRLVDICL
jgi:hypothetical protein